MKEKKLIQAIGFQPKENAQDVFIKTYQGYAIEVDFANKAFNYGEKITAESKTTQNFSQPENWVVLECVDRLLTKGYQPEDITLEKTFPSGHGHSGRLDIYVEKVGKAFLMIECKTYGKEYKKELANTHKNGGQLLTYFQNDTNAEYLMLYASTLAEEDIKIQQSIIKIEPHYRDAGNVVDVFERWNKITLENGIFEDWVPPYFFENKRITKNELIPLDEEASTSLFHGFLSILRKHSVSDKPNAFNVIFDLFLAKLWDEKKEGDEEMDFQWRENEDDPVSFQYRLLDLYREGMNDFLRKEVFGLKDSDLNQNKTKQEIQNIKKKILMLEKVFNIKSVIDEESFEANNRVLKEVVELLQVYQIRYPKKQQHLSDFFERLLTTGLKQEAGQFFTPPPITRFIVRSLPVKETMIKHINQKSPELPAVIDYAAGSGHFLTEIMEEYQSNINQMDISSFKTDAKKKVQTWRIDEYDWASQYVYGVDKDYRLVKVAKVGCYFYGDGLAQVIHGDGLDNFEHSKTYRGLLQDNADKPQFQFVLSNPPYSVSAFKTTLRAADAENDFSLFQYLTDRSSEIECLFVERTSQLLKEGGIAAIILPSSILSNTGIYSKTREIILNDFEIVAITELGSNTFMATGTNTVTLFLRKREKTHSQTIEKGITQFFQDYRDVTLTGIETPFSKYVNHVWEDCSLADYVSLLQKQPNETIKNHEIYKDYRKKIKAKSEEEFWQNLRRTEQDKLLYFLLAYPQQVVVVKSGSKKEEKAFLGYEFSNRRGSEGMHPIQRGKTVADCTKLFDNTSLENPEKASTYIYKAFAGEVNFPIDESLKNHISRQNLVDMLTFDRVDFEKNISTSAKKKVKIESKWPQKKLEYITTLIKRGKSPKYGKSSVQIIKSGQARGLYEFDFSEKHYVSEDFVLDERKLVKGDILMNSSGVGTAGRVTAFYLDGDFVVDSHISILRFDNSKINPKYAINIFAFIGFKNLEALALGQSGQIEMSNETISHIKIPVPPLTVQKKIVDEIDLLEEKEQQAKQKIEELKGSIEERFKNVDGNLTKLSTITNKIGSGATPRGGEGVYKEQGVTFIRSQNVYDNQFVDKGLVYLDEIQAQKLQNVAVEPNDILFNITGASIARCCIVEDYLLPARVNQHVSLIRVTEKALPKFVMFLLISDKFKRELLDIGEGATSRQAITKGQLENFEIPLPPLAEQEKIVADIEHIEAQITSLEQELTAIPQQKEAILKKYL